MTTPAFLIPEGPALLTEHGKRVIDQRGLLVDKHWPELWDICKLAREEHAKWPDIQKALTESGVPTMITSGIGQATMAKIIDHVNGKTTFTLPAADAMALATTAPTSTTTGVTIVEAAYTGYTRVTLTQASWSNAATAATPSVATNNGAITFPACTGGTSTLLGFMIADSATLAAGANLWYGTLTSTVISTTQTPPTVATTAMSLSMTGT
jgi:hypothetical protein